MIDSPELIAFSMRLNDLCDEREIVPKFQGRQNAVAKLFGVSPKAARKWLEAETWPTWEKIIAICTWGQCTVEWLMTGQGPRHPPTALYADVQRLLDTASGMTPQQLRMTNEIARIIAETPNHSARKSTGNDIPD